MIEFHESAGNALPPLTRAFTVRTYSEMSGHGLPTQEVLVSSDTLGVTVKLENPGREPHDVYFELRAGGVWWIGVTPAGGSDEVMAKVTLDPAGNVKIEGADCDQIRK